MPELDDLIVRAERTAEVAHALLRATRLPERWEARGAEVHLVGSLATGLLLRHRGIDLHLYTRRLEPRDGFAIAAEVKPQRLTFANLSETSERCIEWHLWFPGEGGLWQVDVIQMAHDSPYKGYFEHRAARIRSVLTPETRAIILALKDAAPQEAQIPGILFCMAVLRDGIRDWPSFQHWHATHPLMGILDWCP